MNNLTKIYYKIKRFDSFIVVTENATDAEIKAFLNGDEIELYSPVKTTLGFDEEKQVHFIYEWKTYELKAIESKPFDENDHFYKGKKNKLSNTSATLKLENFVGIINFRQQHFEVHSEKMPYEKVHQLVQYVEERIIKLSLSFNTTALSKNKFVKAREDKEDFNKFIFLYHLLKTDKLLNAIQLVVKNPYQHFQNNIEVIDFSMTTQFSIENMIDAFSGQSRLVKCSKNLPIAKKLGGFIPEKINQYEKKVSNDNNENQFVLFFLKLCIKTLNQYIDLFEKDEVTKKIINKSFIIELKGYKEQLSRITKERFFQDVSKLSVINRSSTVLTKRAGYKELYNFYLNIKSVPMHSIDQNDFIELFENKSIDKLYEYVSLFYLDDYLKEIYGIEPQEEKLSIKNKNYSVILDEENDKIKYKYSKKDYPTTILSFQRSYTRKLNTSYAITQNPDFTLFIEYNNQQSIYHFDTKFKMKIFDIGDNNLTDQKRYVKEEDLKSMHAYRDGITDTIGAYVLYPGNSNSGKVIYTDSRNLNNPDAINPYSGIGSIPLQIGEENRQLKEVIENIIEWHLENNF